MAIQVSGTTVISNTQVLQNIKGVFETRVALGAGTSGASCQFDLATATYFTKTVATGATTFTVVNVPAAGNVAAFIVDLTNGGSQTITWFNNVKWPNQIAPTLTAAGRDILAFFTHDAGTTWSGLLLGKDVK